MLRQSQNDCWLLELDISITRTSIGLFVALAEKRGKMKDLTSCKIKMVESIQTLTAALLSSNWAPKSFFYHFIIFQCTSETTADFPLGRPEPRPYVAFLIVRTKLGTGLSWFNVPYGLDPVTAITDVSFEAFCGSLGKIEYIIELLTCMQSLRR